MCELRGVQTLEFLCLLRERVLFAATHSAVYPNSVVVQLLFVEPPLRNQ